MLRQFGILLLISLIHFVASAQDTLPSFTLLNKGNGRIIVSWRNPYDKSIHQLSIQRSYDSAKNFRSIATLPDPTVPENGYADINAPNEHMFYRIYILLDSGKYVFSKIKRPIYDTIRVRTALRPIKVIEQPVPPPPEPVHEEPKLAANDSLAKESKPVVKDSAEEAAQMEPVELRPVNAELPKIKEPGKVEIAKPKSATLKIIPERMLYVKKRDTIIGKIAEHLVKRFKDSISTRSKDTFSLASIDTIVIKTFVPKEVYEVSKYVFTEKDGNVKIVLPGAEEKKYTLKFFDDKNIPVLEIKQIKDSILTLDKSNFVHAGWFKFELYENGLLKEKQKLYIAKDF